MIWLLLLSPLLPPILKRRRSKRIIVPIALLLYAISFWKTLLWFNNDNTNGAVSFLYYFDRSSLPDFSQSSAASNNRTDKAAVASVYDKLTETEEQKEPFVSYQLHYDRPYNMTYGWQIRCILGKTANKFGKKRMNRVELSDPLQNILNVTTSIQTNLKIMSIGDSVGIQFHNILEEAMTRDEKGKTVINNNFHRVVYQTAWGNHESVSATGPVNGGGALAAFRMTGWLVEEGKGRPPPNASPKTHGGAGGWLPEHVEQLLQHNYSINHTTNTTTTANNNDKINTNATTANEFDAMIYRIPHGWMKLRVITKDRLKESLILARKLFGIRTAIVQTLFLNNNVKTMEELNEMREKNRMIREFVEESWEEKTNSSQGDIGDDLLPDNLLLLDFGNWTDQLTELNAKLAGMDQSPANYTLERLGGAKYPPSIAQSCANAKNIQPGVSKRCDRNMISLDGMHWCMESMGGRIAAGIACLLQCSVSWNKSSEGGKGKGTHQDKKTLLGQCQKRCNDEFMSLKESSSLITTTG